MKPRVDARVEALIEEFQKRGEHIVDLLAELPVSDEGSKRDLYIAIVSILAALRSYAQDWAATQFLEAYREAELEAVARLEIAGIISEEEYALPEEPNLNGLYALFDEEVTNALSSIQNLADSLRRQQGLGRFLDNETRLAILSGTAGALAIAEMRRQLRSRISTSLVSVVGKDGKTYSYALVYYADLVARKKITDAMSQATMDKAFENGHDLLRVSPQPSTIGDYCDEYRGKVVSLSGAHPVYPHISVLPAGGAPFHPNCYHIMEIFYDGLEQTGQIHPAFLELADLGEPTPNDFQALWRKERG